jgi:uncharacterized protein with PQ loop repeat
MGTSLEDGLGFAGGALLGVCLVPEVWHIYQTKRASDLSLAWLAVFLAGLTLKFVYLFLIEALAGWIMLMDIGLVTTMIAFKMR